MFKLFNGDCLVEMQNIENSSIDCIICDLPYGTTACKWDTIIPLDKLWIEYKRIIKEKGAIILTASQPFTSALVMSNPKMFRCEWIWDKHIPRGFQTAKYKPMNKHESVLVFGKNAVNYYPIMTKRDKPVRVKNYGNSKSNPLMGGNDGEYRIYDKINPNTIIVGKWEANGGKQHPTQKPVSLMEYLILTYTKENETVLDNTMGSGTTGVACANLNRNFIGIEKDDKYFEIAKNRIYDAQHPNNFEKIEARGQINLWDNAEQQPMENEQPLCLRSVMQGEAEPLPDDDHVKLVDNGFDALKNALNKLEGNGA